MLLSVLVRVLMRQILQVCKLHRVVFLPKQLLGPVAPWSRPWSSSLVSPLLDNNQQPFGFEASLHVNQLHLSSFPHTSWHCTAVSVSTLSTSWVLPIQ